MAPKKRPEKTESSKVKAKERASREISVRRGRSAGPIGNEKTQTFIGDANGEKPAEETKRDALEEELARDAAAPCAERGTNG